MLKVTHIGKFYPPVPGGMERVVHSLCAITKGRLQNRVLAFNTSSQTVEEVVDGVPVTRVGTWGSAGSVPVAPSYAAHLRRVDADVMILHEPNPWALLAYATVRPKIPLAIWLHSDVIRPKMQYDLFYAPVARPAYRDASRFIVSSPVLAERSAALQPYRDRVRVIPFGIDLDRWRPSDLVCKRAHDIRKGVTGPIVLFAGRHVPYKGVNVLIEATVPLDVTVVILGDGPMRETWEALAGRQNGHADFIFTGEVSDAEMHAHFLACDIFVLPSVTPAEAFGFVQLEAMACGKPVISTSLPTGVPWVNQTGIVVPPSDPVALRDAVHRLASDPQLAAQIGAAGRARVEAEFTMSEMGDRLVAVCHELANRSFREF